MATSFRFREEWLRDPGEFNWRSTLALVSACKVAYNAPDRAVAVAQNEWGMRASPFDVDDSQGVILDGDHVVVVAFRGTDSLADWLGNIQVTPRRVPELGGAVHKGFLKAYEDVAPIVENAVTNAGNRSLWITGHSLGGALAVIAAMVHRDHDIAGLRTFGQPRLLGRRPARLVTNRFGSSYCRFVNYDDIVTRIPPGYRHTGLRIHFTDQGDETLDAEEEFVESVDGAVPGGDEADLELSASEFVEMQEQIDQIQVEMEELSAESGIESAGGISDELLDASVEGLIPGVSNHRIDAYLAEVNARAAAEIAHQGLHETFAARREIEFRREITIAEVPTRSMLADEDDFPATEAFEDDFAMEESEAGPDFDEFDDEAFGIESVGAVPSAPSPSPVEEESTYLVRLAMPTWQPHPGVRLRSLVGTIASVSATSQGAIELNNSPMVLSLEASREAGVEDVTKSVPHVRGTAVHSRPGLPEKGDRAVVGVIDTGIDILHKSFDDDQGNSRVLAVWIQKDNSGPTPHEVDPDAFTQDYGTLYLAADIARFRQEHAANGTAPPPRLRDELSGHGTHVASIAAGRRFADVGDGVAPEAGIVVVSANTSNNPDNPAEPRSIGYSASHVDALAFLKRVSQGQTKVLADARPMAVNVSLGMNAGAHDGKTTLEAAFDTITGGGRDPGLAIIKSAGNERKQAGHASIQVAPGALEEITWETDFNSRRRDYLEAWFEPGDDIEFTLVTPGGGRLGPVNFDISGAEQEFDGNLCRIAISECHGDNGHNRLAVAIERSGSKIAQGEWRLEAVGRRIVSTNAKVHIWAERVRDRSIRFHNPDRNMTLSVPGTARSVVTVGACNSEFPMRLLDASSLGLTRDLRPKPELCAPGEDIVAARAAGGVEDAVRKSGTSMAAPHVAGAVALVFSAQAKKGGRQFNANQLQQKLRLTTQNFSSIHNPGFGSGLLDIENFFDDLI